MQKNINHMKDHRSEAQQLEFTKQLSKQTKNIIKKLKNQEHKLIIGSKDSWQGAFCPGNCNSCGRKEESG